MDQDVVGGPADQGVDGQADDPGELAEALEAGGVAGLHAELLGQPVRRHGADPVDDGVVAGGREQRAGGEAVDVLDPEAGVGDGFAGDVDGDGAQRPVRRAR